ncbi:MAG: transposase, partial [Gammaproteobacteria bacterium]|nr:transposase [Gammaproteobacteria bacterium]
AGRESHHLPWQERFSEPPPLCEPADTVERMRHRLKTRAGRALYGKRKQTVEPVFGIIKRGCGSGNFCCGGLKPYAGSGRW